MIHFLKTQLTLLPIRLCLWAAIALCVLAVLRGTKRAGRREAELAQLITTLQVKHAQQKALSNAPRTRSAILKRLQEGEL